MSKSNDPTTFFSTGSQLFARLNNILIIPFGKKTQWSQDIPDAVQLINTAFYGSYFQINHPCVIIDKTNNTPLCLKHIPEVIPEEIKTINDPEFKGHDRNWKYFQYLKDVYINHVGLNSNKVKLTKEKEFLEYYFDLCWFQLEERKIDERKNPPNNLLYDEDGCYQYYNSWEMNESRFPLNDSRVVYESLLPIYEPHLFFNATGFSNKMEQDKQAITLNEGYCDSEEYILPTFQKEQTNKSFYKHTRIDFAFWTGTRFLFYEIDGNTKWFSKHIDKQQAIDSSDCFLRRFTNSQIHKLYHIIYEQRPEYLKREEKLRDDFPAELLRYWELTSLESPLYKLWSVGSLSYHDATEAGVNTNEVYKKLPYHFRYEGTLGFKRE